MSRTEVVIVGGGFHGIFAAWKLIREGVEVTLLNASSQLGGTMRGTSWRGYSMDQGCHNLDLRRKPSMEFFTDILGDELSIIANHSWSSTIDRTWTPGLSWPDFSVDAPHTAALALNEMTAVNSRWAEGGSPVGRESGVLEESFLSWYADRYGQHLATVIEPMVRKMADCDPQPLGEGAFHGLNMFSRPQLGNDRKMVELKSSSVFWNDHLGVSPRCRDSRFLGDNTSSIFGYPRNGGLGYFCDRAERRLAQLGVNVVNDTTVLDLLQVPQGIDVITDKETYRGRKLFWTLPDHLLQGITNDESGCQALLQPVGFCIHAFEVDCADILGPDFLMDFSSERMTYRYSSPGRYGDQIREDGSTYILAEIPTHPANASRRLDDDTRDTVWQELKQSAYIEARATCRASTAWNIPVAFSLPRMGWRAADEQYRQKLARRFPDVIGIASSAKGRSAFIEAFDEEIQERLR